MNKPTSITSNSRLCPLPDTLNTQDLTQWAETQIAASGDRFHSTDYKAIFRGSDFHGNSTTAAMIGRLGGFAITVSRSEIRGTVDIHGKTVYTHIIPAQPVFDTVPFAEVFSAANHLFAVFSRYIEPDYADVPLYGGIECVMISDEPRRILSFSFPETAVFGKNGSFQFYTAPHLLGEISAPVKTTAEPIPYQAGVCPIASESLFPDWEIYEPGLTAVINKIKSGQLEKIVVARMDRVIPKPEFDPDHFAASLESGYFQEYFYRFTHGSDALWVGISPGVLVKQSAGQAMTRVLAGSAKKGHTPEEDQVLIRELQASEKDRIEHDHALDYLYQRLHGADIGKVEISKNKVIFEAPYTFHLQSELVTNLKENLTVFDMIRAIYPPATVWGIPVSETEKTLPSVENFNREFYSGAYGTITCSGDANLASIIRSCKIENGMVDIYTGGGIIAQSDPREEFAETVSKMGPLRGYFA